MEQTMGFRTITYCFRLYCEKDEWLWETKKMYNRVLRFYYEILVQEEGLKELNKQKVMRELEIMSIGTKNGEAPKYPVPFEKVPLYLRRAAINDAIRMYRSFDSGKSHGAHKAEHIDSAPTFYKGMYKDFCSTSVSLKLYNGDKWQWVSCSIDTCDRAFPPAEQILSPTLKLEGKRAMLHVPVKQEVLDVRSTKERLNEKEKICAVYFPNSDTMAAMVVLDTEGNLLASKFIHGGKSLAHRKQVLLERIEKNRKSMGFGKQWNKSKQNDDSNKELFEKKCDRLMKFQEECADNNTKLLEKSSDKVKEIPEDENKALKEKIRRIIDNTAHKVSRQIVDFCKEQDATILVVPNYKQGLDFNRIGYVNTNNYDWLGRRIISYARYKAFGEGIVTVTASTKDIASKCYICGAAVKKYNQGYKPGKNFYGGKNYVCPNGHQGNSYFNSAMNVGMNFLGHMGLRQE